MADNYEIRLQGYIDVAWAAWFDGLAIRHAPDGTTLLYGEIEDQAALHGILVKIRDLGVPLLSLRRLDAHPKTHGS